MASPAARLLAAGVNDPGAVFAFFGRTGRSPRVFAARDRDGLLRQAQAAALNRMGITMAGAFGAEASHAKQQSLRLHQAETGSLQQLEFATCDTSTVCCM